MSRAYAKAGVDIVKADQFVSSITGLVKSTFNKNVIKSIGGYAALYKINSKLYIAATTDGVGTKLKLGFELDKHDTVGIDLVAMSVNDLVCVGATPLFFLDYIATGKLDLKSSQSIMKGIVEGCKKSGVALIGGETAEMPGMYSEGEYDLAGFAVGTVTPSEIIDGKSVRSGDVIIGLESSGPHSNGFSLIRKLLSAKDSAWAWQAFVPTRIYVKEILALKKALKKKLKGLAHITGSGFLNIPRVNERFDYEIKIPQSFSAPLVFHELQRRGKISDSDMYTTFNMGFGMIAVVDKNSVPKALQTLRKAGASAHVLGQVAKRRSVGQTTVFVRGEKLSVELKY